MCSSGAIESNSWTVKHRHCGLVAQAVCGPKHQDLIIQENLTLQGNSAGLNIILNI